jgi:hypothetical protein
MSNQRDILKSLLLKEELKIIAELKQKILSKEQFTKEVSEILSAAINRARRLDSSFERALSRPIKKGVTQAFTDNKQSIIDSLLPIMGQLIRKTVTNSIKQFVSDINRALEQRFSMKAIKWRWQARKAGISFAEIVFQKTISYQVKELFVINHENGLLIQHVGANDMLIDNNAISAMLTAIQDFIGDSLQTPDSGLSSAAIGDVNYFISPGPKAYLATVVKGEATGRLKEKSQQLIENIHADFSELLTQEEKYQQDSEFEEYLRLNLLSKSIAEKPKKINWLPWIIIVSLVVLSLLYYSYQRNKHYHSIVDAAQSVEGLYVKSINSSKGKYIISGLLDPLADTSKLKSLNILLDTKPFISLDQVIIEKRVQNAIANYKNISFAWQNNSLILTGELAHSDSKKLISALKSIAGINSIDNQLTNGINSKISHLFAKQKETLSGINYRLEQDNLILTGKATYTNYHELLNETKTLFPQFNVLDSDVSLLDSTANLAQSINNIVVNIPSIEENGQFDYSSLVDNVQKITARNNTVSIDIIGESDCHGKTSNNQSMARAQSIADILIDKGVNRDGLTPQIKPCTEYINHADSSKLNVTFNVKAHNKADLK